MLPRQPAVVAKLRGAIGDMTALVTEHRASFDRERNIPRAVFEAMADAGLFRLWLPKAYGGFELSPVDFMAVVEAASALDGTIGWLVGNGGGIARCAGYLPEAAARDVFSDRRGFLVSSTGSVGVAVPARGGYRIAGRWPFGSGIHHATQLAVLCAPKDEPTQQMLCYAPASKARVIDTWHVSGLRGTGSCDFALEDVFVPATHTHAFVEQPNTQPALLYRLPNISAYTWTVATVPLGIAQGAIAFFVSAATSKTRGGNPAPLAQKELVQDLLGRVEAERRSARAFLVEAMDDVLSALVQADTAALLTARAIYRTATAHAAETAVSIVDRLHAAFGAMSIHEHCPLERAHRDVHAAVKHIAMSTGSYALAGRVRLGLDPGTPRF